MSEHLPARRGTGTGGINRSFLRLWGLIIAALGILGRGILQNRVLMLGSITGAGLSELLSSSGDAMNAATVSLVLQAAETLAVPIFAFLTVDGVERTGSIEKYLLRVGVLALVSEVPYNLALNGTILDTSSRNPVFGLVLVIAVLYLYRSFPGRSFGLLALKTFIFAAAWLWAAILRVEYGRSMVIIALVLWILRDRHLLSLLAASAAALTCCVGSPLFMFAPLGFLLCHFYNGEEGNSPRPLAYALYPLLLLLTGAAGWLLF